MTIKEIREEFKRSYGASKYDFLKAIEEKGKTTIRCEFVEFVDYLLKDHRISQKQADRATGPKEIY